MKRRKNEHGVKVNYIELKGAEKHCGIMPREIYGRELSSISSERSIISQMK